MSDYIDEKPLRGGLLHRFKKIILILIAVVIVLAIALGVGLGIGLKKLHDNGDEGDNGNGDNNGNGGNNGNNTSGNYPLQNTTALWQPAVGSKWQIILSNPVDITAQNALTPADAKIWDLDLFDNNATAFQAIQAKGGKVICYFSAGTYENWRPDANKFSKSDLGSSLPEWQGENWLKISSSSVRTIMSARIKMASDKGCNALDPDNMDGYSNKNGLGLTQNDTIDYVKFLASEASKYNLSIGLKNAGEVISSVLGSVQFSVQEQCIQYGNCKDYSPFIQANKPVFNIEYPDDAGPDLAASTVNNICDNNGKPADIKGFTNTIKRMSLDGWVEYCDTNHETANTPILSSGGKPQ